MKRVLPRYVNLQHLDINDFPGMEQAVQKATADWRALQAVSLLLVGGAARDRGLYYKTYEFVKE